MPTSVPLYRTVEYRALRVTKDAARLGAPTKGGGLIPNVHGKIYVHVFIS